MADIFSYSFQTTAKNQLDNGNTADPDAARSDVNRNGDWTTAPSPNGNGWQVTAAANYPGGAGGLGFRNWRGDGSNNVSGGASIVLSTPQSEIWVRFYMRYQAGFVWTGGGNPGYTKEHYWDGCSGAGTCVIFGHEGGGWGISDNVTNYGGNISWTSLFGGPASDGLWHCFEYHVKKAAFPNGQIEIWVDNVQSLDSGPIGFNGTATMGGFKLGENAASPNNGQDMYVDYDDIVVSNTGRVGPIPSGPAGAPSRVVAGSNYKIWTYR